MANYNDIGGKFGIIYTCNCGWLDRAHSYTTPNPDKTIGAANLWMNLLKEDGFPDYINKAPGFVVASRQEAMKKKLGIKLYPGVTKHFVVRKGLPNHVKQQVALAIFMEVSIGFESLQDSWAARTFAQSDSGFSEEDLVSNLVGFYKALFPIIDIDALCKPVSIAASRAVWNASGPVGRNKNRRFEPVFHPCSECTTPPVFPDQFKVIVPAVKGVHFIDYFPPRGVGPLGF